MGNSNSTGLKTYDNPNRALVIITDKDLKLPTTQKWLDDVVAKLRKSDPSIGGGSIEYTNFDPDLGIDVSKKDGPRYVNAR